MTLLSRIERLERVLLLRHSHKTAPAELIRCINADGSFRPLDCIVQKGWPLHIRRIWHRAENETEADFEARVLSEAPPNAMLLEALDGEEQWTPPSELNDESPKDAP